MFTLKLIQMKRVLNLRNTFGIVLALMGLFCVSSSFTFGLVDGAPLVGDTIRQKEQKVKVVVVVDGKKTSIDTTFNLPDDKIISERVDSILDQKGGACSKSKRMTFSLDRAHRIHDLYVDNPQDDEQFEIQVQNGDSGKMYGLKKVIRVKGFKKQPVNGDAEDDELLPPPPPVPPHSRIMFDQRFGGDPFAFDTRDESVVSYEKKDIGNGLEKITIVRKKHEDHQIRKEISVKVEASDAATSTFKKKEAERQALKKLKEKVEAEAAEKAKK